MSFSAWNAILNKAFKGNMRIKCGRPRVIIKKDTGAPNTSAPVGTLCWNSFDNDAYICTGGTTWVKINA